MSLASTATVTGVAWFVVAESGRACGGGASGAATVRFTLAVADSPPESVTVYWNESVPPAWSIAAVARTVAPSARSWTIPLAAGVVVNWKVSPGSGSLTRAERSMFVARPAWTSMLASAAVGGRLLGGSTFTVTEPATMWPFWSSAV